MTEKQFTVDNRYVMQNGETYVACADEHSADVVATALNELLDENEQLKSDIIAIEKRADKVYDENKQLKKEYDKLKHVHSLLHDVCIEAECDRDRYHNDVLSLEKENEQLKETIKELELENAKHIGDGEWDIRDITYCHGKFRLEEWGERYHQFYNGDEPLEDEEVVSLLFENEQLKSDIIAIEKRADKVYDENKQLKLENGEMKDYLGRLEEVNEQLKQEKPFLKIHNDYFIQYGDDRELFSMHKPSDIRSLMYLINRENGYSELQSQYNDLERVE